MIATKSRNYPKARKEILLTLDGMKDLCDKLLESGYETDDVIVFKTSQ